MFEEGCKEERGDRKAIKFTIGRDRNDGKVGKLELLLFPCGLEQPVGNNYDLGP